MLVNIDIAMVASAFDQVNTIIFQLELQIRQFFYLGKSVKLKLVLKKNHIIIDGPNLDILRNQELILREIIDLPSII